MSLKLQDLIFSMTMSHGGGLYPSILQMPDYDARISETDLSYTLKSDSMNAELRQMFWVIFQSQISQVPHETIVSPKDRLKQAVNLIPRVGPFELDPEMGLLSEHPDKYSDAATKIQRKVKDALAEKVERERKFVVNNHHFSPEFDEAERHLIDVFMDLYHFYLEKGLLEDAHVAAKKINASQQGAKALLSLALVHLQRNEVQDAAIAFNSISPKALKTAAVVSTFNLTDEIVWTDPMLTRLSEAVSQTTTELVQGQISQDLIDSSLSKGKLGLALTLALLGNDTDQATKLNKIVEWYLERHDVKSALVVVPKFTSNFSRDEAYKKVIAWHVGRHEISATFTIIPKIDSGFTRNEEYKKLIKYYLALNQIAEALKIIPKIDSSFTRDEEHKVIIKYYLDRNNLNEAINLVPKVESSFTRDELYGQLIDICIRKGDIKTAKEIVRKIESSYTRDRYKAKFFDL